MRSDPPLLYDIQQQDINNVQSTTIQLNNQLQQQQNNYDAYGNNRSQNNGIDEAAQNISNNSQQSLSL